MVANSNFGGGYLKNTNKKGFTLIELLAVIVIIGLVAVIAVPITINIVESSKRESIKTSVVIASGEIEYYMMENDIDKIPEDGIDITKLELKDNFESGRFIEKDGEIEAYFIKDKEYCVNGPIKKLKIAKKEECYKVDNTAAKVDKSKYHLTSTSKSITVTIEEGLGIDPESGIKEYKVKVDGKEKIIEGKSGQVIFEGLKNETEYKVEIIIVNRNNIETKINDKIKTKTINTPIYLIDKEGWAQSKVVTIDYQDEKNQYAHEYSLDGGIEFKKYNKAIEFKENGTVIARVNDGTNYVTSSSQTVANIDRTAPTSATFTYTKTSKSITVIASGTDSESGIYGYQFSKDDGATWTSIQTGKTYTFDKLTTGTYKIKVKVINNTYNNEGINSLNSKESTTESIETTKIDVPTYAINKTGWAQSKKVTITYP
ncbi:MAG: prepilin-type N-terminal cleavage/methylation domain-containing protein, partial [Lactobacillales bacterium]|nr:prepilin-type N-terminal cleavage/methylation domain-containing protein [Lactobacillales bacterium]